MLAWKRRFYQAEGPLAKLQTPKGYVEPRIFPAFRMYGFGFAVVVVSSVTTGGVGAGDGATVRLRVRDSGSLSQGFNCCRC